MKSGANRILTILIAILAMARATARADSPSATAPAQRTVIIELSGEINEFSRDQLIRHLDEADAAGAQVILMDIDTYGGQVTSALDISRAIKRQKIPVIAFVKDKAISAGAMAAMACNEIVMGQSASLGDCAPIVISANGLEGLPPTERDKLEAPIRTDFAESAARNHHDPLLAQAMVHIGSPVYWVQDSHGNRKFVAKDEFEHLRTAGEWQPVPNENSPIITETQLLTVDSDHAVKYGLATGKAESAEELASQRNYTIVDVLRPGLGQTLVYLLSSAAARVILLIIFLQCFYIVLHAPGHGVAEVVGLVALGLMLGVPLLTGYATWWEILLIFIGLGLIAVEIFLPGHMLPGITGAILVLIGLVMTFVPAEPGGPGMPRLPAAQRGLEVGIIAVAVAMAISLALWVWISRFLPKLPLLRRLVLTTTSGGTGAGKITTPTGQTWPAIGAFGVATSDLRPGGSAEFFDESISDQRVTSVISESGYIIAGAKVQVRDVGGGRVVVVKRD